MQVEWIAEDSTDTIGHATKLELDGVKCVSPVHAITTRDFQIAEKVGISDKLKNTNLIMAGESLDYSTLNGVGVDASTTNALYKRLKAKILPDKIKSDCFEAIVQGIFA